MKDPYDEFKSITDKYYSDWEMPNISVFVDLLSRNGINLRNKDGQLIEATFSVPKAISNILVLGMRYKKIDDSYSEDLFLFQKGKRIKRGYKGSLQKILPEYAGTQKGLPSSV